MSKKKDIQTTLFLDEDNGLAQQVSSETVLDIGQMIGNYRTIELVGIGGMGEVWRAEHLIAEFATQLGDVAIKVMLPQFTSNSSFVKRFVREAALGKQITHPNVAQVFDVIVDDHIAVVMEFIRGKPLDCHLEQNNGPFHPDDIKDWLMQIAAAVDHLHEKGIIHRDLKPENILISEDGVPKIVDFGIAKELEGLNLSLTQTGSAIGTPNYMAPEQMDAKNVTEAADRYAFGMMVYELLSGAFPWDRDTSMVRIGMLKMSNQLKPINVLNSNISDKCSSVVMKMLNVDPEQRYETCRAFCEALFEQVQSSEIQSKEAQPEKKEDSSSTSVVHQDIPPVDLQLQRSVSETHGNLDQQQSVANEGDVEPKNDSEENQERSNKNQNVLILGGVLTGIVLTALVVFGGELQNQKQDFNPRDNQLSSEHTIPLKKEIIKEEFPKDNTLEELSKEELSKEELSKEETPKEEVSEEEDSTTPEVVEQIMSTSTTVRIPKPKDRKRRDASLKAAARKKLSNQARARGGVLIGNIKLTNVSCANKNCTATATSSFKKRSTKKD